MTRQCRKYFQKVSEYLDGELNQDVCRKIEEHLQECPECIECLESLKKSIHLCKEISRERDDVPLFVRERLRSSLRECLERKGEERKGR